ncbi:MAG: MFS transporter [Deltaproteobacteria bacterium]|nr:MFS transporter [Deltaproteobacteria bacterium]
MESGDRATRIELANFSSPPMRAFHMSWLAFFTSFVGWFAVAPLMPLIRGDLGLSRQQIGTSVIASVALTFLARLLAGRLLDRFGPRRIYSALLVLGSVPVMAIGLARSYESFLLLRMAIGAIGASFVVTQYHTSLMFAPNVVGTANATAAGWGNLGGGAAQLLMPLALGLLVSAGVESALGWRLAMIAPGVAMLVMGVLYARGVQDTPQGNFEDLQAGRSRGAPGGSFSSAARDPRVWALFVAYGACFGLELTLDNVAALYFFDRFELDLTQAGAVAAGFGAMNLFARPLGGWLSDRVGSSRGVTGRATLLGLLLLFEGFALLAFSRANALWLAIPALLVVGLFVKMSNGATYGVVPFLNRRALGSVTGIVGAGGNAGAVAAGFLFRDESLATQDAFLVLGAIVTFVSAFAFLLSLWVEDRSGVEAPALGSELST